MKCDYNILAYVQTSSKRNFYLSISAYADAGYGYRFFIKAELGNTETYEGYIYVYSYEEYQENASLITFLKDSLIANKSEST